MRPKKKKKAVLKIKLMPLSILSSDSWRVNKSLHTDFLGDEGLIWYSAHVLHHFVKYH